MPSSPDKTYVIFPLASSKYPYHISYYIWCIYICQTFFLTFFIFLSKYVVKPFPSIISYFYSTKSKYFLTSSADAFIVKIIFSSTFNVD